MFYDLQLRNVGGGALSGFAIQLNKNLTGLTNASPLQASSLTYLKDRLELDGPHERAYLDSLAG